MAFPWSAVISGGLGLAGMFGRKTPRYEPMAPFQFNPNENDPELLLLRRRAMEEGARDRSRTTDEISRAGLLGSSASFDIMGEQERRQARNLEDIDAGTFARRRSEALDLYKDEANFRRQKYLQEAGGQQQEDLLGLGGLGDLGGLFGGGIEEFLAERNAANSARQIMMKNGFLGFPSGTNLLGR